MKQAEAQITLPHKPKKKKRKGGYGLVMMAISREMDGWMAMNRD